MFSLSIAGLGASLPDRRVTSAELERDLRLEPGWIEAATGIRERRYAEAESAVFLAAAAARQALARAEIGAEEVDLLIGASSAPEQAIPCTAALVHRALGMPAGRAFCFDVNATCASFLAALAAAAGFFENGWGGKFKNILIFSSEISRHARNLREPESAVLFGDAAAAALIRPAQGGTGRMWPGCFQTHSAGADLARVLGGGTLHHPNDPATTPDMNLFQMDGRGLLKFARHLIKPCVDLALAGPGWTRSEVDAIVPHQTSRPGMALFIRAAELAEEKVESNLLLRGNCVAASIPLALCEAVEAGRIRRGDKLLLCASGAGFSIVTLPLVF